MHKYSHEEYEDIAAMIKSGDYFKDVTSWYDVKYHNPMVERCFFVVITALASVVIFFSLSATLALFPLSPVDPIVTLISDLAQKQSSIKPIGYTQTDANRMMVRFLSQKYVENREEYVSSRIEPSARWMQQWSSADEYRRYRAVLNPANPNSPISQYERHTSRSIKVNKISVVQVPYEGGSGIVKYNVTTLFDAEVSNVKGSQVSNWKAEMQVVYRPLLVDENTEEVSGMDFVVTEYKVSRYTPSRIETK